MDKTAAHGFMGEVCLDEHHWTWTIMNQLFLSGIDKKSLMGSGKSKDYI